MHVATPLTGWRPDPTARYEGRYYVAGRPTNRVRNGRRVATDPTGGRMLPDYREVAAARSSIRLSWPATGATTVIIVLAAVVVWGLLRGGGSNPPSPETGYLSALKDAGLANEFNSDAGAIARGKQVCRQLEEGGPEQGLPADKFAVEAFCPQFAKGFRILESATAPGTFVLTDSSGMGGIIADGTACEGANGYSDVGHETQVTVKNGKNEILATTTLGQGKGDSATCTFSFSFPVTEGQDRYVVSIGRRGEFSYTFAHLRAHGVQVRLGH
ncbi:DUF732 domain-containing protein [Mycobacterium sp. IS-3022]|uniref:DUF732 domain-containing protein n=1 Tax=Mycobacterium sp. IS-3022 TaxID=1772277 RepID=UPI0025702697|nr:DUF732 domain-containing protein [Mycobacterium sp. IS-3022]